ncbi:MAG: 3-oxoacyl-(acyl-carrier-protein) reductase [Chloroflexi bacterium]|nr:3-oxoacyl-(acyl-carrier-protein) reductase [Chloroflexota bacterium]
MATTLEGHVALVTGATKGIGRGIALELARQGARVAVTHRVDGPAVRETLEALSGAGPREHLAVAGDVRHGSQVRSMVAEVAARLGPVDILVNNAGIGLYKAASDLSEGEWDLMIDTNLKGPFLCAQAVAPGMIARQWGRIINITSTGSIRVVRGMGIYSASKAGLAMLTQAFAAEWGRDGITVNGVGPSTVPTDINRAALAEPGMLEAEQRANPSGRIGTTDDIAAAVAFLASDAASWINGQNLIVDGGLTVLSAQPAYNVDPPSASTEVDSRARRPE